MQKLPIYARGRKLLQMWHRFLSQCHTAECLLGADKRELSASTRFRSRAGGGSSGGEPLQDLPSARGRDHGGWSAGRRGGSTTERLAPGLDGREASAKACFFRRIRLRNDVQRVCRGRIISARGRARMGAEDKGPPAGGPREQWLSTIAALTVGVAFFSLWFWLLPGWLGFRVELAGTARWRWLAAVPSVLGFAVALRCVWDFGWTGRGTTPAPVAPPNPDLSSKLPCGPVQARASDRDALG